MRNASVIILTIITSLFFVACEQPTMLSINQTALTFDNGGGNQSVAITANKMWTTSSNQGWLRVSPPSGEGSASISVSCEANTTYDSRAGTITITSEELTQTISVTQAEVLGLIVSQTEFSITNDAQTISVEVQANVQYTIDIDAACRDWIKQNTTKGLSSNTIKFDISKNEAYDGREGKITIRQTNGTLSETVIVKQSQTNGLFVSTPEYSLSNEKHTLTVEVKSNIEFEVKSEVDWIRHIGTKGLKTSQITLEVAANEEYDSREGKVVVKQKDGNLTGTITIKQDEKHGLLLSETNFDLTNEQQNISFELKYNVPYEVVIPSDCKSWINQVGTKGLDSKYLTFSIAKNDTYDNREGSITIKQKDGPLSGTVSIKQSQTNGLIAEKTEYELTADEQSLEIKIRSNVSYEVVINDSCKDWISQIQTKGLTESVVSLMIAENTGSETRTGIVALKNDKMEERISIRQNIGFVVFEDANFKAYCVENYDKDGDGEISLIEAEEVTKISIGTKQIASVKGIEFFKNLETLYCEGSPSTSTPGLLTSIDVSNNTKLKKLDCYGNQIEVLDLSNNPELTSLSFSYNRLSSLDCSHCPKLKYISCTNNQINKINLSNNPLLKDLYCRYNSLNVLDLSVCDKDVSFSCWNNPELRTIWLRQEQYAPLSKEYPSRKFEVDKALVKYVDYPYIIFNDNNFESYCLSNFDVDGDGKITYDVEALAVKSIDCSSMGIVFLDGIEYFLNLEELNCSHNLLSSLNHSYYFNKKQLKRLDCSYNSISTQYDSPAIYFHNNPAIVYVDCSCNKDLSDIYFYYDEGDFCKELEYFNCTGTSVCNLYLGEATKLKYLNCYGTPVSSLNLMNNTSLEELYLGGGNTQWPISELNVKNCTQLEVLICAQTEITEIDVSLCKKLRYLELTHNQITNLDVSNNPLLDSLWCTGNAMSKLVIGDKPNLIYLNCHSNRLSTLDVSNCKALQVLICNENQLANLDVSRCTALKKLSCYKNQLTNLDVNNNIALVYLACQRNQLSNLDVKNNKALNHLDFGRNSISSIDLSRNTKLEVLYADYVQLISLDVSNNTDLRALYCNNNPQLKEIWLKTGQTIKTFAYDTEVATIKYK